MSGAVGWDDDIFQPFKGVKAFMVFIHLMSVTTTTYPHG
jgi:hypothetical protein